METCVEDILHHRAGRVFHRAAGLLEDERRKWEEQRHRARRHGYNISFNNSYNISISDGTVLRGMHIRGRGRAGVYSVSGIVAAQVDTIVVSVFFFLFLALFFLLFMFLNITLFANM